MEYVIGFVVGAIIGGLAIRFIFFQWQDKVRKREAATEERVRKAAGDAAATTARAVELEAWARDVEEDAKRAAADLAEKASALEEKLRLLAAQQVQFDHRVISYRELRDENTLLKRDLQNIDVNLHKLAIDGADRERKQQEIASRSTQFAKRYLGETVKAVVAAIGPDNFTSCKQKLLDVIGKVREIGFEVSADEEAKLLADLRREFEKEVRIAIEREEQARIKAQIREEERLRREIDRELKQAERERLAIQAALDQALAEANGQHSLEVERLQQRLTEAEEKAKRAISMAQQTKAGHVYVISNIGTFGTDVFKVGMTRRLEPTERVDELGSASVPFPFDVHMMIHCENAPALENALHKSLHKQRINKANPRKEFFRVTLDAIREIVVKHHGEVQYVADPEALEYRQSLTMTQEDADFIEKVYKEAEKEIEAEADGADD